MASQSTDRRLRDAVRRLIVAHGALEHSRRPCGTELSIPHAYALLELWQSAGPMTVSELAATLAIDRTNVSRLCARMEKEGHLARAPHPEDGRARALVLTARGKKLARSVDAQSAGHFARLARELQRPVADLVRALDDLAAAMNKLEITDDDEP